jgi:hypothetical protein
VIRRALADIPGVGADVPILDLDHSRTRIGLRWGGLYVDPFGARLTLCLPQGIATVQRTFGARQMRRSSVTSVASASSASAT